jgi:hypothetical protein
LLLLIVADIFFLPFQPKKSYNTREGKGAKEEAQGKKASSRSTRSQDQASSKQQKESRVSPPQKRSRVESMIFPFLFLLFLYKLG